MRKSLPVPQFSMSGANDSKTLASKCLSDTSPTRNSSRQPQDADTDGVLPPGDDGSSEFVQRPGKRDDVSRYARPVSARGVPLPPPIEASIHAIDRLLTEQELAPQRLYSCGIASDVVSEGESRPPHRARARGAGARGESAAMWRAPRILELRVRRPASRLAISARSSSSGNAASFSKPAYKRSSWRSDIESRSTPPTRSSTRGRCNQRAAVG
jgi:hypothetical protein